ncbi:MAG: MaoC/PaaZ C-terminal domain-containing protein [Alphaproteobacteria bacterium]
MTGRRMQTYYFDDFKLGDRFETRRARITESQIIDFSWAWDPQPMHLDPSSDRTLAFGGLMSSGFHTMCITFRLWIDLGVQAESVVIGRGIEQLQWTAPVRPDDILRVVVEVIGLKPSSRPGQGTVSLRFTTLNHKDETVMTAINHVIFRCRPEAAGGSA